MVTLRDHTELQAVTGELDAVRGLTESLRSQNHEAANRLHTVVSLIEMGRTEEAVDFATEELQVAQLLTDRVVGVGRRAGARRAAARQDRPGRRARHRAHRDRRGHRAPTPDVEPRDLVTVLGNLVDNALDAVVGRPGAEGRGRASTAPTAGSRHASATAAPACPPRTASRVLERGWSTKAGEAGGRGLGLALVAQVARRHGGEVHIGTSPYGGAEFTVALGTGRPGTPS